MPKKKPEYPLLHARKIPIRQDDKNSPPGISDDDLRNIFSATEFVRWANWSAGATRGMNGFYAWDVESFLEGSPNLD